MNNFKGIVKQHDPHVVQNLYEFISSAEHKRRYFKECW